MNHSHCSHSQAIPAADFAAAGGWYCPQCKRGCSRPAIFSPPPKIELVSNGNTAPPLLTNPNSVPVEKPPNEAPISRGNDELSGRLDSKPLVNVSKRLVSQGVYEISAKGIRYFRYVVNEGNRITISIHVKGGNTNNSRARGRAEQIRRWIAQGLSPETIAPMIRKWH